MLDLDIIYKLSMWWNPSLSLTPSFLEVVPALRMAALENYPVEVDKLRILANIAVDEGNLYASLGALMLWQSKSQAAEMNGEFEIIPLANIDRCFYSMSEPKMTKQMQLLLHWYARLTFQHWFQTTDKRKLQDFYKDLKELMSLFEKSIKSTDRSKTSQEVRRIIQQVFNTFQKYLEDSKTAKDREYFKEKFKGTTQALVINQKEMYFFNLLYQIEYLIIEHLHRIDFYIYPKELIGVISNQIFFLMNTHRLSFSIQHMAFVMKKILLLAKLIPSNTYRQFMNLIESIIKAFQLNQINLTQKIQYFSYHMSYNHYFSYVEKLLGLQDISSSQRVKEWKVKLRKHIEKDVAREAKICSSKNIDEAIFYLKLRNKPDYLYANSLEIHHFPDIKSVCIQKFIDQKFVETTSQISIAETIYKELLLQVDNVTIEYKKYNVLEKGIFFYYLCYIIALRDKISVKQNDFKTFRSLLDKLYASLSVQDLFQIAELYLIQLQIGNHYGVTIQIQKSYTNLVNPIIYRELADILYYRMIDYLQHYKAIDSAQGLNSLFTCCRYFAILAKSLYFSDEAIFVCPTCIRIEMQSSCPVCQEITLGIQLKADHFCKIPQKDVSCYKQMVQKIVVTVREARREIDKLRKNDHEGVQWLCMLDIILSEMIYILR